MLLNNAYLALDRGEGIDRVVGSITRYIPVTSIDRLVKNLAAQAQQPVMRTYMFSYPKGIELVSAIAQQNTAIAQQNTAVEAFVRASMTRPLRTSEIEALVG